VEVGKIAKKTQFFALTLILLQCREDEALLDVTIKAAFEVNLIRRRFDFVADEKLFLKPISEFYS